MMKILFSISTILLVQCFNNQDTLDMGGCRRTIIRECLDKANVEPIENKLYKNGGKIKTIDENKKKEEYLIFKGVVTDEPSKKTRDTLIIITPNKSNIIVKLFVFKYYLQLKKIHESEKIINDRSINDLINNNELNKRHNSRLGSWFYNYYYIEGIDGDKYYESSTLGSKSRNGKIFRNILNELENY